MNHPGQSGKPHLFLTGIIRDGGESNAAVVAAVVAFKVVVENALPAILKEDTNIAESPREPRGADLQDLADPPLRIATMDNQISRPEIESSAYHGSP